MSEPRSLSWLVAGQQAIRNRFEDLRQALEADDRTAIEIALADFHKQLQRWTEAEEEALLPALVRARVPGRDPRRELRLEYVQLRELTRYLVRQIAEGIRADDLSGFVVNLERRLRAHEREMETVYCPAAAGALSADEWKILEAARPDA